MSHSVFLGASTGIGYYALLQYLTDSPTTTATVLLRKPDPFKADPNFKEYLDAGRVQIVKGDATNEDDVKKLFEQDAAYVISTIGGKPHMTLHGAVNDQPTLCTDAALVLLHVLASLHAQGRKLPRVIAVSTMGLGENHKVMPLALRIIYPWLLHSPHQDKLGLELLLQRASSVLPTPPQSTFAKLPFLSSSSVSSVKEGFLPEVIIIRPAMFAGEEPAKGREATKVGEKVTTYTIRRREVSRVIVEDFLGESEWVNRLPMIGY
ncbi:hypothetical protein L202_01015 [Cryptococcus amylolentus CBS 6039]|uniref:NAD(P)-binding domain-containing protein n=2 Tax=Cryptococcus amylolentus TaxID=104669 RepID=A0A1E3I4J0_9TREE|nr:hypothetical protein L202_01015 [Cryptococcus amylolentus CBS 6039]ODN82731.1 hypothetical protein L202_01015 [Cryptococcus amylolentus CBS 6039]ODO10409.1 hypothetical protein I350_01004 [Cryptococcus amylolentus CBS 6273]